MSQLGGGGGEEGHEIAISISSDMGSDHELPLLPEGGEDSVIRAAGKNNTTDVSSNPAAAAAISSYPGVSQKEMAEKKDPASSSKSCTFLVVSLTILLILIVGFPILILLALWLLTIMLFLIVPNLAGMILEGIPSSRRAPSHTSKNDQTDTFLKLGAAYSKKNGTLIHTFCKVVLATLLLAVFISVGVTKGKVSDLLGFRLWKWMFLLSFITVGRLVPTLLFGFMYNVRMICSDEPILHWIDSLPSYYSKGIRYYVYWLTDSLILVLYSAGLLVIWLVLFLKSLEGRGDHSRDNLRYGTATFVCLFIGSVLLFVKTMLLLISKAGVIYERFSERMVRDGAQLYILALFCGLQLRILGELAHKVNSSENVTLYRLQEIAGNLTLYRLQEIAECFQELALVSSRDGDDEDKHAPELEERCERLTNPQDRGQLESDLLNEFKFEYQDVQLFEQNLRNNPSLETVQQWMVNVHTNSLAFGYTLLDAKALVDYLDKMLTAIIVSVVVVTWLLIVEVATTKVLVVIASPFLATTFIFGDMCKQMFEGIIFTFVSHPFVVGEKCLIEGNELQVKQMGVLRTRFEKVDAKENVSFSNSELATKAIVNLSGEVPTDDQVELNLVPSTVTKSHMEKLETSITSFLEKNGQHYSPSYQVDVTKINSSVNMTISFEHRRPIQDVIVSKWLQEKLRQRSKFLEAVNQMLINAGIERAS